MESSQNAGSFNADCYKIPLTHWWWSDFFFFFYSVNVFFFYFLIGMKTNECVQMLLLCLKLAEHHAFSLFIIILNDHNFLDSRIRMD